MSFKTQADAKKFFARYGQEVGFGVKLYRSRPESKWVNCIHEGESKYYKLGEDRKRKKTSKRVKCKAAIWKKKVRGSDGGVLSYTVDYVNLDQNHSLLHSPATTQQFQCNKQRDSPMVELIGEMQDIRCPHHCIVNMVSNLHDGLDCIPMTHKDIANM
ncbi:hypothetical protein C2845_PM03G30510 [Panicum miliaceum]|uniref:FAR1 domain-containing protein n=1 Tax=Panicum miliaceum TaxID=4540 RepID=A0A3L6T5K5_PANMI|nr:hypothetical protein C2845_PM03G30510 [Panicum miliaceum]